MGVVPRLEARASWVVSRVVAMPELPPLPPPPVDLIVASPLSPPARPFYALYSPVPYVNKRGTARLDDWVPGDALVALKLRLREAEGLRPAVAVGGEMKMPLSRRLGHLQSGSGTGGLDVAVRVLAGWHGGAGSALAALLYTRVGRPALDDRIIVVGAGATARDEPLDLPDRLEVGLGLRRPLAAWLAAAAEATATFEVGARTPVADESVPVDVLGGVQLRWRGARVSAGLRYHAHALRSGERRRSPLAGLVDLTDVAPSALASYLGALGLEAALPSLRPRTQRVLLASRAAPLPPGARVLPAEYVIRSEHQVGFLVAFGWAF